MINMILGEKQEERKNNYVLTKFCFNVIFLLKNRIESIKQAVRRKFRIYYRNKRECKQLQPSIRCTCEEFNYK